MRIEKQSPYLDKAERLADLVAAIQALGSYRYAAREEMKWRQLLHKPKSAETWGEVFRDHPEFFRASSRDDGYHQLVLRRAQSNYTHVGNGQVITLHQLKQLTPQQQKSYSRSPLSPEQILALTDVAIKLQNQAVARRQELRWWVPVIAAFGGAVVGGILGGL